jgi:hypothetical protein
MKIFGLSVEACVLFLVPSTFSFSYDLYVLTTLQLRTTFKAHGLAASHTLIAKQDPSASYNFKPIITPDSLPTCLQASLPHLPMIKHKINPTPTISGFQLALPTPQESIPIHITLPDQIRPHGAPGVVFLDAEDMHVPVHLPGVGVLERE